MSDGVGPPARRRGLLSVGFVTLALVGEWLGHAGSWWLSGGVGPGRALSGPMHAYLGPVGLLLALLAVATSGLIWWALTQLNLATQSLRAALGRAWRRDPVLDERARSLARSAPPRQAGVARLWLALASVQVVVYVAQETLELHLLGRSGGGLHVVAVHHGLPLAVHATVALAAAVLAALVADIWRAQAERAAEVARLFVRLSPPAPLPDRAPSSAPWARPPLGRFGLSLAARPPPGWVAS